MSATRMSSIYSIGHVPVRLNTAEKMAVNRIFNDTNVVRESRKFKLSFTDCNKKPRGDFSRRTLQCPYSIYFQYVDKPKFTHPKIIAL